jgi:hypothetical protein
LSLRPHPDYPRHFTLLRDQTFSNRETEMAKEHKFSVVVTVPDDPARGDVKIRVVPKPKKNRKAKKR